MRAKIKRGDFCTVKSTIKLNLRSANPGIRKELRIMSPIEWE